DFYPAKCRARLGVFVQALQLGRDANASKDERARALWEAAQIARHEGMELFGTEVEPDWHLYGGGFFLNHVSYLRSQTADETGKVAWSTNEGWFSVTGTVPLKISASSSDEKRRLHEHKITPDLRFHYRYYAADLAWDAAQLMPDNTDETARV